MKYPSAERYSEAVQNPIVYFSDPEIKQRKVQTDALSLPEVLSGGFAFTYRFSSAASDIAVRCFHREIPELFERYKAISSFIQSLHSDFFVDFSFSEVGVRIDGIQFPIVTMEWVQGETLLGYVSRRYSDRIALQRLRDQLLLFADEAENRGYAHGDVQHRNLMVTPNGSLKLVDYDSMYVPALRHLKAADTGHPNFQPPSRSIGDFGPRMDRFALAAIDLSLEALIEQPQLFDQFHRGENLILSRDDFLNPAESEVLLAISRVPKLAPRVGVFADMCRPSERDATALRAFVAGRGVGKAKPTVVPPPPLPRQGYTSPFAVVDGMNYAKTLEFVGDQIELVGQVLQVRELALAECILLRFGETFRETPAVVVPKEAYLLWEDAAKMQTRPWISATGVLQTYTSWGHTTVQVRVKETSDIQVLSGRDEAEYRFGNLGRPGQSWPKRRDQGGQLPEWLEGSRSSQAATSATVPQSPTPPVPPQEQSGNFTRTWERARDTKIGVPDWLSGDAIIGVPTSTSVPTSIAPTAKLPGQQQPISRPPIQPTVRNPFPAKPNISPKQNPYRPFLFALVGLSPLLAILLLVILVAVIGRQ